MAIFDWRVSLGQLNGAKRTDREGEKVNVYEEMPAGIDACLQNSHISHLVLP